MKAVFTEITCMTILTLGLAGCLESGDQGSVRKPALDLIHFKETNRRDHPDFCLPVLDSYKLAYRNGNTLRILFGRNTADCGRPLLNHIMVAGGTTVGDSVNISIQWPLSPCIDTPLYSYIEAAYEVIREDAVRFVLVSDGSLVSDTNVVLSHILEPFPCGD
jgi:hypothetical protein